ncbi:hypothetical protein E2C01_056170 [Portunus trituberculatus]|uniref:Uncharacterized protein n=1 Tax=Portunus trituberculatus TaxID=210409 RepID=A0A5B7GX48_PORTR|nr:hypothetical protein [Portunus trituberculatus]
MKRSAELIFASCHGASDAARVTETTKASFIPPVPDATETRRSLWRAREATRPSLSTEQHALNISAARLLHTRHTEVTAAQPLHTSRGGHAGVGHNTTRTHKHTHTHERGGHTDVRAARAPASLSCGDRGTCKTRLKEASVYSEGCWSRALLAGAPSRPPRAAAAQRELTAAAQPPPAAAITSTPFSPPPPQPVGRSPSPHIRGLSCGPATLKPSGRSHGAKPDKEELHPGECDPL